MTKPIYKIVLEDKLLGTTKLEFGDPPMGIVFGQVFFAESNMGYDFIKQYCIDNSIHIQYDYPTDKLISTGHIKKLKVYNSYNREIVGLGNTIEGMDSDRYTITILGIDSEIYEQEFPNHIVEYEHKVNNSK